MCRALQQVRQFRRQELTFGAFMSSFIASRAASWQTDAHSAPEHPSVWQEEKRLSSAPRNKVEV